MSQPRRVLHIGNIMNNGYLNAKFLRRAGLECDAVTVDYRHVQGQPEWEEVAIREEISHFEPNWAAASRAGYSRPPWFFDVCLAGLPELAHQVAGRPVARVPGREDGRSLSNRLVALTGDVLLRTPVASYLRRLRDRYVRLQFERSEGPLWRSLLKDFDTCFPGRTPRLSSADVREYYLPRARAHTALFALYPLIQAYGLDPIYVLLGNPGQPFICFEHGTLREFPFEDSARGRLYALCVQKAEKVIITNADCIRSAKRLGLTNYCFIPHPVDDERYCPRETALRHQLRAEHGCDWIFIAPARHHWKNCPRGLENSWLKRNDIMIRALGRLFVQRPQLKALVVSFNWGQEVNLSKQLIAECGFADRVRWEPLCSKPVMVDFYNAADIVFDQFNHGIGSFGTVVPEALGCGKPVITNFQEEHHRWCFPESPPLLHAPDEEMVLNHTVRLLDDEAYRKEVGTRGRQWFLQYHSSKVVVARHLEVYREISDRHGWGWF